jgi:hypothetical protein
LPSASEWPHVLKLSLRLLQPLPQVLGVFIVRVVVLFVRFQQCLQAFDAMLFFHHTLSVFKLAYTSTVSDCFHRFTGFYTCVWLNVVLGVGGVVWFGNLPRLRLLYVDMAHVTFFYGNDETEFSKKLNFRCPESTSGDAPTLLPALAMQVSNSRFAFFEG